MADRVDGTVELSAGGEPSCGGRGTTARFEPDERHTIRSDEGARVLMVLAPWPGAGHYRGGGA